MRVQIDMTLQEAIKARADTQSELDDLLILFGDLEDRVDKYKVSNAFRNIWGANPGSNG